MRKIVVLGTGGTIAGKAASAHDNVGYVAGAVGVEELLSAVPRARAIIAPRELVSEQLAQLDSKDMNCATWSLLAKRCVALLSQEDVDAILITHGTDTLEETAYFLHAVIPLALQRAKPVVLTCAMRPASALTPDGPQNLQDALSVACDPQARGVVVVASGHVHAALYVAKRYTYRVDAFDSGDAGVLGLIEEEKVRWLASPLHVLEQGRVAQMPTVDGLPESDAQWPRVEIVISYAGAGAEMLGALASPSAGSASVRGIVIAGTGNGTIHKNLLDAAKDLQQQGVRIVRTSRCAYGLVVEPSGGAAGAPDALPAMPLPPVKARIALMLELLA